MVWHDLGLNPGLPDNWRTLSPKPAHYIRIFPSNIALSSSHANFTEFLAVNPYRLSFLTGPLGCTLCQHKANVHKYLLLIQHWQTHVYESIEERLFLSSSLLSSSASRVLFVLLRWFERWVVSGRTATVLCRIASTICSRRYGKKLNM